MENDKKLLQEQIASLNEEMHQLAYKLRGLLDVDCNLGVCAYNPEAEDREAEIKEVQERKALLERIMQSLDSCKID